MNPQLERLFHSVRRGIEENVRLALKNMEIPRKKDLDALKKRIDQIKSAELVVLRKKLDEVKTSLSRVEAFKPYFSALGVSKKATTGRRTKRRKSRSTPKSRRRSS